MTPVQAGALFSLWQPTRQKPQDRSKMATKTEQKSHKLPPGPHFLMIFRMLAEIARKSSKMTSKRNPKMRPKSTQKRDNSDFSIAWGPHGGPRWPQTLQNLQRIHYKYNIVTIVYAKPHCEWVLCSLDTCLMRFADMNCRHTLFLPCPLAASFEEAANHLLKKAASKTATKKLAMAASFKKSNKDSY